jgi:ADP-heptose:LPS heptosyltransferase
LSDLQIYDPRERALVAAADHVLDAVVRTMRVFRSRQIPVPRRILLLRLERIGDLLMALPAIGHVRTLAPDAQIDLIVGSWNQSLAGAIPGIDRVETLDARWLAREGAPAGMPALLRRARAWRARRYDLALNFEPDIRSNLLMALSGARWRAGFRTGGGGALLDVALDYDTRAHTTDNAVRLVGAAFGRSVPASSVTLALPDEAVRAARAILPAGRRSPLVGIHVSGGRAIKQWDPGRFADVAVRLTREHGATIVLTGSLADRPLTSQIKGVIPASQLVDAAGDLDLPTLAALLRELDLLLIGDTGPMHLAAAVGTPVVAVFGPSDPVRYATRGPIDRVVRVDLPCSPCNRIRRPPTRCAGHTPDCLTGVSGDQVYAAVVSALADSRAERHRGAGHARA